MSEAQCSHPLRGPLVELGTSSSDWHTAETLSNSLCSPLESEVIMACVAICSNLAAFWSNCWRAERKCYLCLRTLSQTSVGVQSDS